MRANTSNVRDTTQNYLALFAQDTWTIGSRVTINPGLRYERQHLTGTLADLTLGDELAPRIGATWDPTGQARMKVYGNWGLFYTPDAERPGGPRAVGRRRRQPRRLLRRGPDPADS